MNANRDLERLLAELYAAESYLRVPDRVLASALATIDSTPQHSGLWALVARLPSFANPARFAVTAVFVVAATAIVLAILSTGPSDTGGRFSPVPTTAPSATPRANEQRSGNFVVPFTYVLPAGAEFDYGTRNPTYFEIRNPAAAQAGHPAGLIVQAIGGGRVDPCAPDSSKLPLAAGPQAVIDYLKIVPDLTVTAESTASVGELPAVEARVTARTETPTCEDIRPWVEATEAFTDIPRDLVVRIVAVDVGEHVVFTVFGEDTNPGWNEMADELIDSFRFETPLSERSPAPS